MNGASDNLFVVLLKANVQALTHVWLLYRAPHHFREWLESHTSRKQLALGAQILAHLTPYIVAVKYAFAYGLYKYSSAPPPNLAMILVGVLLGIAAGVGVRGLTGLFFRVSSGIGGGIAIAIAIGFMAGIEGSIPYGIGLGIAAGIVAGIAVGIVDGVALKTENGALFGLILGFLCFLGVGAPFGIVSGVAFAVTSSRGYYMIPHLAFIRFHTMGRWYCWHPVAWDYLCSIPFSGLDILLSDLFESNPSKAEVEVERLISSYPSQRNVALRARCRVIARKASMVSTLQQLDELVKQLPRGEQPFLVEVPKLVTGVFAISKQYEVLLSIPGNLPFYRLRQSRLVVEEITAFRNRLAGFAEPLSKEFRKAAEHWLSLAEERVKSAWDASRREPFPQVFRAGDPVQGWKSEAFIPRAPVIQQLTELILSSTSCTGILLYARRRMGKSTCLQNLGGYIPANIDVAFLNLQDPKCGGTLRLFVDHVTGVICSLYGITTAQWSTKRTSPDWDVWQELAEFSKFLDVTNGRLEKESRKLLIALDEFEYLDLKLGERDDSGRKLIPEDLLALFRTSIQSHRNVIWLFSGSHRVSELKNAEWPSYFISLRTVEIDRFTLEETTELLTDPLAHASCFKESEARPKFPPEFWGDGGIKRLQEAADGWPHLVVLLAENCVTLANQRNSEVITDEMFIEARKRAVEHGENVMIRLVITESEIPGERQYLLAFHDEDCLCEPESAAIAESLQRRTLVKRENNKFRLRVPLIHQWIRERSMHHFYEVN